MKVQILVLMYQLEKENLQAYSFSTKETKWVFLKNDICYFFVLSFPLAKLHLVG